MRFMFAVVWSQLIISAQLSSAMSVHRSIRSILVGGPLPARFYGQVASFGNPLDGSDGNDMTRGYNLMVRCDVARFRSTN